VPENPLADWDRCGFGERLVGGKRGHRERGCFLPWNRARLPRDKCGRSDKPLRPPALVSQRQWVGEHFVARSRLVTSSPTASTMPAASTPSASGGRRPTSQSPTRTISSQLPTPAADERFGPGAGIVLPRALL
jgi:hypothetical protein